MKKRSLLAAVMMVAALGASVYGCAAAPAEEPAESAASTSAAAGAEGGISGDLNMVVTWQDYEANALQDLATAFMEKYPDTNIVVENLASNSDEIIASRDAAGNLPDIFPVFNLGPDALGSWVDSGKIADISSMDMFQALPEDVKTSLTDDSGAAYAMMMDLTGYVLMWNTELFEQAGITEAPTTLSAVTDAVEKLNAAGIQPFALGAKDGWTISNCFWRPGLDYAFPAEWNAEMNAGEASFTDYGYELFPLMDLVFANADGEDLLDVDSATAYTQFGTGEAAMIVQGPWAMDYVVQNIDPEFESKVDSCPIPWGDDIEANKQFLMQRTGFVFSADANLDLANAFLDFWANDPEGQEIMAPYLVSATYYENLPVSDDPISVNMQEELAAGHTIFDFQDNNRSSEWFMTDWTLLQEYAAGRMTQDEVLQAMDDAMVEFATIDSAGAEEATSEAASEMTSEATSEATSEVASEMTSEAASEAA